ncbi:uncharacterized protein LOC111077173 [Drosophila obscura]|uniref:uncharacterized protein LOC111077173 n=1 Tax=Drosophila obscura TaxID=7282 RepID=UPI001BB20177|nr:uncharacterized protein LOC111077173 [Drosophila obscura]
MSPKKTEKPKRKIAKENHFISTAVYRVSLPDPDEGLKFLPCGKALEEYAKEIVTFPEVEAQYDHHFEGLEDILDVDLITRKFGRRRLKKKQLNPEEADLLADIGATPSRDRECAQMFAKERDPVPRPRAPLKTRPAEGQESKELEALSQEEQTRLINQTFEDVQVAPKPKKNVHLVAEFDLLPDEEQTGNNFVDIHFDVAPRAVSTQTVMRDCGASIVNFVADPSRALSPFGGSRTFVSDQRFTVDHTAESNERGELLAVTRFTDAYYYVPLERTIKLKRQRPSSKDQADNFELLVREQ